MIDVNEMRRKFPGRDKGKRARDRKIKAIAREYELKKAELAGRAPVMKKGVVFYAVVIMGLLMLGSLVLSVAGKGGKPRIEKAQLEARKSVDALATALGRYRYHIGEWPSNEEGLAALASTEIVKRGWNGPYIRKLVKDPWGRDYVYVCNGEAANPSVYSKGADGIAGTTDDVLPAPSLFEEPFRDTSWTKNWMPYRLRGYILAPDEETKKDVERQVQGIIKSQEEAAKLERRIVPGTVKVEFERVTDAGASGTVSYHDNLAAVDEKRDVVWPDVSGIVRIVTPWSEGAGEEKAIEVEIATVGDEVELFLNGESKGRSKETKRVLPYEEGELKAIAYRGGEYLGETVRRTAYAAEGLRIVTETDAIQDDEIIFVKVEAVDGFGTLVADFTGEVTVSVEGPGEAVIPDAKLKGGVMAFALHRFVGSGKPVSLKVSADGLRQGRIVLPRRK
ncbi:MAG: type II secretion system protein GspG [Kiritimatiellae bacterium]|nr:type II secretion system protein GspG [Kiritimatiellia bacterium]